LNPKEIPEPLDYDVIHAHLPSIDEFTSPGTYIQFIDKNANVVVKSNNLGTQELPISRTLINDGFDGKVAIETVSAGEDVRVRIMASPMYLTDQTLLLEVAQSLEPIDTLMSQVRWALLIGIVLALILVVISGAGLIRRALVPVKRITVTARNIESGSDLSQRVGYSGPMDEIGELGMTFDHMIEKLDRVFQSQRFFVADASHELRSPLTVIRGNLDLIKRDLGEKDRIEALRAINMETDRMVKIVDDLLILAEAESGNIEHQEIVSLKKVLLNEAERAKKIARNRKVRIGRQEDLTIKGDSHRLRLLLWNLVDNAIRHTPDGGTITLSLYRDGNWACLEVADTGKGIARYF
jgi:signal transduction histidine kinase